MILNGTFTIKGMYYGIAANKLTVSGGTITVDADSGISVSYDIAIGAAAVALSAATRRSKQS